MKKIGFWKEYTKNANDKSIFDLEKEQSKYNLNVLKYLKSGIYVLGAAYTEHCIFTGEIIAPSRIIYTDGLWLWTTELIYYYSKYKISLQEDFLIHIEKNNYLIPRIKEDVIEEIGISYLMSIPSKKKEQGIHSQEPTD